MLWIVSVTPGRFGAVDSDRERLKPIGRNIVVRRTRLDMTQAALAEAAGISLSHLARMERGQVDARLLMYFRVARALQVDLAVLLEGATT